MKSFYHFSQVSYPLYIHDGGLLPWQGEQLTAHFPGAKLISLAEGDHATLDFLRAKGWDRCAEYRGLNPTCRKLFDFFVLSRAERVLSIDSDIVFFRCPTELLDAAGDGRNFYNRDESDRYSMSGDELEKAFGIRPPACINSGLSNVRRESMDFVCINKWLQNPKLFADRWVTEQTLHALCSTMHGVAFLPDIYLVSTRPGLSSNLVCKHYPGFWRPLLYSEGMTALIHSGFLRALSAKGEGTSAEQY